MADGTSAIAALLVNASVEDGARVFRKCAACHAVAADGRNKVGPLLYNVVGSPVASNETFRYSDALSQLGADGSVWTFDMLNEFLTKPRDFVPGTKMGFSGLRKEEDRINLLAYLRAQSDSPVPLP